MSEIKTEDFPLIQFEGEIILADNLKKCEYAHQRLVEFMDQKEIAEEKIIFGFDTETRPSFTRGTNYKVALLQFSTDNLAILIRTHFIAIPPIVRYILESPEITKVGLACHDDVKAIKKVDEEINCVNIVDVAKVAKHCGHTLLGLNNLCHSVLGKRVSKKSKLTNWENEHLTSEQILYAATDAFVTLQIYQELIRTQGL